MQLSGQRRGNRSANETRSPGGGVSGSGVPYTKGEKARLLDKETVEKGVRHDLASGELAKKTSVLSFVTTTYTGRPRRDANAARKKKKNARKEMTGVSLWGVQIRKSRRKVKSLNLNYRKVRKPNEGGKMAPEHDEKNFEGSLSKKKEGGLGRWKGYGTETGKTE